MDILSIARSMGREAEGRYIGNILARKRDADKYGLDIEHGQIMSVGDLVAEELERGDIMSANRELTRMFNLAQWLENGINEWHIRGAIQ